jgi:type II secretory pathway component PulF
MTSETDSDSQKSPASPVASPEGGRPFSSFAYDAQTAAGESMVGTIGAYDVDDAMARLAALGLRVMDLRPVATAKPKPLRGDDFTTFNQQLGQLASAGLPLEQGLRLIAQDMRTGRLARTVNMVADELERGVPLGEAFARHQSHFPPLYGRLMDAGIRTGNLPAMLLNLGRYAELVQRLRATLWRAISYPLAVSVGLVLVLLFLSTYVLPKFDEIYEDFQVELPAITRLVIGFSQALPALLGIGLALLLLWMVLIPLLRRGGSGVGEAIVLSIPLVGPVVRRGLLARWCDAVKLSVDAGLDLPAAFDLASQAIRSKPLQRDGELLLEWLHNAPLANVPPQGLRILPPTVAATVAMAVREDQLSRSLGTLAQMYAQQVEQRTHAIPAILGPLLLILITIVIGAVILAMVASLIVLIQTISGGF